MPKSKAKSETTKMSIIQLNRKHRLEQQSLDREIKKMRRLVKKLGVERSDTLFRYMG